MAEQVYCVFCYGSENWCWSGGILDRFKGCERNKGYHACVQTLPGYCTRTALAPRTIWQKMKLRFWSEMIAERMRRAMGWTCDTRPRGGVDDSQIRLCMEMSGVVGKHKAWNMTVDPNHHTRWRHKWRCTIKVVCGIASQWAGERMQQPNKYVRIRWRGGSF